MKLIQLLPLFAALLQGIGAAEITSHEPQRPLPVASSRPLPKGEIHVIDNARGDDANAGTEAAPWRTLDHAIARMPSGGTLCLRGGVYYSHSVIRTSASREKPLIIRSWPGELAVLDGGEAEFASSPESAWEPHADGVPGEFRSTKAYPLARTEGEQDGDGDVLAMGRFIDSMIPLHGARFHGDLQSDNPWWNISSKSGGQSFVYCGPAVWQDGKTGRIHCRLAHTKLPGLGADNYTGITDARKTPLCIATVAAGPALTLARGAAHRAPGSRGARQRHGHLAHRGMRRHHARRRDHLRRRKGDAGPRHRRTAHDPQRVPRAFRAVDVSRRAEISQRRGAAAFRDILDADGRGQSRLRDRVLRVHRLRGWRLHRQRARRAFPSQPRRKYDGRRRFCHGHERLRRPRRGRRCAPLAKPLLALPDDACVWRRAWAADRSAGSRADRRWSVDHAQRFRFPPPGPLPLAQGCRRQTGAVLSGTLRRRPRQPGVGADVDLSQHDRRRACGARGFRQSRPRRAAWAKARPAMC